MVYKNTTQMINNVQMRSEVANMLNVANALQSEINLIDF